MAGEQRQDEKGSLSLFPPLRNGPEAKPCEVAETMRRLKSQANFLSLAAFP